MLRKEIINISDYYLIKAEEDNRVADNLSEKGQYAQAIYFKLQYMEKFIKSELGKKINLKNKKFSEWIMKHDIKELTFQLIELVVVEENLKNHLKTQIENILGEIKYGRLYNNLRYPYYNPKTEEFYLIEFERKDYEKIIANFKQLRSYIENFYRI